MECNFHLKNGIYFRREGERFWIAKALDFNDPGKTVVELTVDDLASVVASLSPNHEEHGSFDYARDFIETGAMYCGGCGCRMLPLDGQNVGHLSIVNRVLCAACYRDKFKALFDYALCERGAKL